MRVLVCALLGLAVLTGCGGNTTPAADGGGATVDKARERENAIATCMKQKGFPYTSSVSRPKKADANPADYAAMKEARGKYGSASSPPSSIRSRRKRRRRAPTRRRSTASPAPSGTPTSRP